MIRNINNQLKIDFNSLTKLSLIILALLFVLVSLQPTFAGEVSITNNTPGGINGIITDADTHDGDTIVLEEGLYNKENEDYNVSITKNLTFKGNGNVTIDAQNNNRIFTINSGLNVTFININFINGKPSTGNGGAILNSGDALTITNCMFNNNVAGSSGGAISSDSGVLNISGSNFTDNAAKSTAYGGAINYQSTGKFIVIDSYFENNTANNGAAIRILGNCNSSFINSTFIRNLANDIGGAINLDRGNGSITGCNFTNNSAKNQAGALISGQFTILYLDNSTFKDNIANRSAGAVTVQTGSTAYIHISTFINNKAFNSNNNVVSNSGGAINNRGNLTVINSTFINNTAVNCNGGAINNRATTGISNATIINCTFKDNNATYGGAVFNTGNLLFGNTMSGNNATVMGNMIYNDGNIGILNLTYLVNKTVNIRNGSQVTLLATLTDDMGNAVSGKNVSFMVNGVLLGSVEVVEGLANVTFNADDCGLFGVSGNYSGIDGSIYTTIFDMEHNGILAGGYVEGANYIININNGQLRVYNKNTQSSITVSPNIVKLGQTISVSGVLVDEDGNFVANVAVKVVIGGKTFTTTTNERGQWIIAYTTVSAGSISAVVSFDGTDELFNCENSTVFLVSKVKTSSAIIIPSNVKVNQNAVITGTLKDENRNLLKGVAVVVTVDGKKYNLKTDTNGKWSLTFKKASTGNVNVLVSFAGNSDYEASSTTDTFTVKEDIPNKLDIQAQETLVTTAITKTGKKTVTYKYTYRNFGAKKGPKTITYKIAKNTNLKIKAKSNVKYTYNKKKGTLTVKVNSLAYNKTAGITFDVVYKKAVRSGKNTYSYKYTYKNAYTKAVSKTFKIKLAKGQKLAKVKKTGTTSYKYTKKTNVVEIKISNLATNKVSTTTVSSKKGKA